MDQQEPEPAKEASFEIVPPSALESIERAQIDMQIATARRYPRTTSLVIKRMTGLVTLDEETAASCFYRLNRQGKAIEGPSIRLAEIAVSAYGNIRFGARVVANDGKQVTAQGFCHDLENNVMSTIEVKRRITDKNGRTYSDDMQVVTGNAACAIAARNAVFKVIPFAMVKPVLTIAKKTAIGDIKTLPERRTRMLEKLAGLGVNEKRVCQAVNKPAIEDIGLTELEILYGLYNAVKEEEQTVEEAFPEVRKPIAFDGSKPDAATPPPAEAKPPAEEKKPRKTDKAEKAPPPPRATPLEGLRNLMTASHVEDAPLLVHLFEEGLVEQGVTIDGLTEAKIKIVVDNWLNIAEKLKQEA